ncbi:MAG: 5'/3'-nucleotidase SurE [Lachnospiraceae bacterium]|nr:5'/3'-nucleotidase SurE [Lachnospiraceae bacterium]MBO6297786.1 5'/3'-nucleotidase SurE [Lachnospiraceae bacterium]
MRILVTNDDGIGAEGLRRLAETAKRFGEVWVVAPADQCSAMSQCVTIRKSLTVRPEDFPVDGVKAYSVTGTPADCVDAALGYLMKDHRPDWCFSGMNRGYNAGFDIAYSGTVGAAMQALMLGVPAIAFSNQMGDVYEVADRYMAEIAEELLKKEKLTHEIWNVNFPGCSLEDCKGIEWDVEIESIPYYYGDYPVEKRADGSVILHDRNVYHEDHGERHTDVAALLHNKVSVGKIRSMVL